MSGRPHPTREAIARIQSLGEKALLDFFAEVSPNGMRELVSLLPTVDGFRKNSAAGIQQQKLALAKILIREKSANPRARQYLALYAIWRQWAAEHLAEAAAIDGLLKPVEEASGNSDNDQGAQLAAQESAVNKAFSELRDWSLVNKCPREAIERFFTFSPFSNSAELRTSIDGSKALADIQRDTELSGLPKRLRHDEDEIKLLDEKLRTLSERIEKMAADIADGRRDLSELRRTSAQANSKTVQTEAALDRHVSSLQDMGTGLAEVVRAVGVLREQTSEQLKRLSERVAATSVASEKFSAIATSKEQLNELERRLSQLEKAEEIRQTAPVLEPALEPSPRLDEKLVIQGSLALCAHKLVPEEEGKPLTSIEGAVVALSSGLQRLGLRKSASEVFAAELCAATFIGQVVFLKGSLAVSVARMSARFFGGRSGYRVSIPIGLNDGEVLRDAIADATTSRSESISAVAIEGLNRSALDVFADVLFDVRDANFNSHDLDGPVVSVFVSLVQGMAALPIEPSYLQLGPVFDLDLLDWQIRTPKQSPTISSEISKAVYKAIFEKLSSANAENEEPLRLLRKFSTRRNPRIERTLLSAFAALTSLRGSKSNPSTLQSLAYGWLVPLWASLGVTKEEVDSELDAGKFDTATADPRLAAALSSDEFRSRQMSEEP